MCVANTYFFFNRTRGFSDTRGPEKEIAGNGGEVRSIPAQAFGCEAQPGSQGRKGYKYLAIATAAAAPYQSCQGSGEIDRTNASSSRHVWRMRDNSFFSSIHIE